MKIHKCQTCGSKVKVIGEVTLFYEPVHTIGFIKVYQNYYVDHNKHIYRQHPEGYMEYVHTVNDLPAEIITRLKESWER